MKLKVISFNIRCKDDANGHTVAERAPRLEMAMRPLDADVIGFQEYTPLWEPYIQQYFGQEYEMYNLYRAEKSLEGVPILWKKDKFECIKKGRFWLSDTPEVESRGWDEVYNCYRICLYAVLKEKATGKCFTFMNTHFGFGDKGQMDSGELVYRYSKQISDLPTFVTGDFNLTKNDPGYATLTRYFTDVNAATDQETGTTYHGYSTDIETSRIDFCFADEKVTPLHQKTIRDSFDGKYPSDHYGIYMELDI